MAVEGYVLALALAGMSDAISYMVVTPSLIFYILQNGGTQSQYGFVMSSFSFASFCTKPFLGWWSDVHGFRLPYLLSLATACLGGFIYTAASALPDGQMSIAAIFIARLLGGVGMANSALGFAYVARVVPQKDQTAMNSFLSILRIFGMALGPAVNLVVSWVDVDFGVWRLDSLNSVGLILVLLNFSAMLTVAYFLEEPRDHKDYNSESSSETLGTTDSNLEDTSSWADISNAFISLNIIIPMLSIFTFNANFQLIETGFPPAANDALGWGPITTSLAMGSISLLIALNMFTVIQLSKRGVTDAQLLSFGMTLSAVSYTALYFLWVRHADVWTFYAPVAGAACSFPFLAAPTRSIFTAAVNNKPLLSRHGGSMQAILSMMASMAGFLTPGFVATYCLKNPEYIDLSENNREMTKWSLFAPCLALLTLMGVILIQMSPSKKVKISSDDNSTYEITGINETGHVNESTSLVEKNTANQMIKKKSRRNSLEEIHRASTVSLMGVHHGHHDDHKT